MRFDRVVVDVNKTLGDLRFTKFKLKDRFGIPNAKDCVVTLYSQRAGQTFDVILQNEVNFEPETPVELVGDVTLRVTAKEIKQGDIQRIELEHRIIADDIKRKGAPIGQEKK